MKCQESEKKNYIKIHVVFISHKTQNKKKNYNEEHVRYCDVYCKNINRLLGDELQATGKKKKKKEKGKQRP